MKFNQTPNSMTSEKKMRRQRNWIITPLDHSPGSLLHELRSLDLDIGASADDEQHHSQERLKIEQRWLLNPTTPTPSHPKESKIHAASQRRPELDPKALNTT